MTAKGRTSKTSGKRSRSSAKATGKGGPQGDIANAGLDDARTTPGIEEALSVDALLGNGSASDDEGQWEGEAANDNLLGGFFISEEERLRVAASYVAHGEDLAQGDRVELLAFWVADEQYSIGIGEIQEIIKVPHMTPVPRVHKSVLGVTSLRGTVVPVVDLRRALSLPETETTRSSRVLVLRAGGEPVGLLVDRVTSVVRLDTGTIEPPPRSMTHTVSELLTGVGRVDNQILIILNPDAVLTIMEGSQA